MTRSGISIIELVFQSKNSYNDAWKTRRLATALSTVIVVIVVSGEVINARETMMRYLLQKWW